MPQFCHVAKSFARKNYSKSNKKYFFLILGAGAKRKSAYGGFDPKERTEY